MDACRLQPRICILREVRPAARYRDRRAGEKSLAKVYRKDVLWRIKLEILGNKFGGAGGQYSKLNNYPSVKIKSCRPTSTRFFCFCDGETALAPILTSRDNIFVVLTALVFYNENVNKGEADGAWRLDAGLGR